MPDKDDISLTFTDRDHPPVPQTVEISGLHYSKGTMESRVVSLAREVPYTLFVNDLEVLSIAVLPSNLENLFVGFLVSEGVLASPAELEECVVDHENRIARLELKVPQKRLETLTERGMLTSGCAGGLVFSAGITNAEAGDDRAPIDLTCSSVRARMVDLDTFKGVYRETRGVHAASVAEPGRTLHTLEDLGRHNAVDKIAGHCFLTGMETQDKLLLTTGRITSEVLTKAARSRFRVIISRSSASALAAAMAKQCKVDLFTYVRAGRFYYFANGGAHLIQD